MTPSAILLPTLFLLIHSRYGVYGESSSSSVVAESENIYKIEGKVTSPDGTDPLWYSRCRILIDGGDFHRGFLKSDNSFVIQGLSPGSYLVEVLHPDYSYPSARVDINSKGKIRARKVNNLQPSQVNQIQYPLRMKPAGRINYFEKREQWKWTDVLMNPMILMMVLPLLLITVLPKLMIDPETKKEMEQMQQNMNVQNQMPEFSELMANFFGAGSSNPSERSKKKLKPVTRRTER
ncbi:LOW QUALITY PROTEIN: endoplasmic reticulum membrane protein complex subunit 7 [Lepeophtheirus salmonis]|uniref:LOW QUALITY PROTEIN: endoplasmic reticulum membrane protein complex subunit 7 n=1 Tax=Lepeophtheirus salmonis TaxID=72036 RepID=UPI001AE41DF9|nr:LOW QUALITY PROTEIN: ER membrane protein complex subunit 7-like [Lepeophtheirus salmonis]